jgi:UDP-N-acetylmuramyl tripeptide synthase
MKNKRPLIILDRGEAIHEAISKASAGSVVLITGKGTDPYIMGSNGTKTPWSDFEVATSQLSAIEEEQNEKETAGAHN